MSQQEPVSLHGRSRPLVEHPAPALEPTSEGVRTAAAPRSSRPCWWQDGVIYQIYPRSFADGSGDGVGDLEGILEHLDYLKGRPDSLGVDALWLSPFYPSPGYDFGYDISDYEDVDPLFGNLSLLERLIEEAHRRDIRVILDLVMNHTSHLHPWFVESRSSRSNPKRDWYLWQDPGPFGRPPNNWQAVFGGPAWEWDASTGQFYYHMFLKEQPDLNWRNPEVQDAMLGMVERWLQRGVDGFRLDVVNAYIKDERLRSNPFTWGLRPYDQQKHLYDKDRPELKAILQRFRSLLDRYPERYSVGEVMGHDAALAASYVGDGRHLLHQAFNFTFLKLPWRAAAFQKAILEWDAALPEGAWPCQVLNNHDISRVVSRTGGRAHADARAKVAATLLLTLRGTPFLYYGEELGLPDTPIPRAELVDPPGRKYWPFYKGRDPARTPMPWSAAPHAGFSPETSPPPWLRLNPDWSTRNVVAQQASRGSVWQHYQGLLKLRRESVALRQGAWRPLITEPDQALCYLREHEEQVMLVALNFGCHRQMVSLDAELPAGRWQRVFSARGGEGTLYSPWKVPLEPFEATIYVKG